MEKTKIEDLANEIFYEIFEYLNYFQSYEIFTNLKQRFRNFFANSTSPVKLNLRSVSRSIFTFYYRNIIVPNPHRIQSPHLSNPFFT
ncbi:unnamed protein product [Adineta steineri]|uniref:Uncharacterized protein n=1 Tax=Adineta steineri TaxID=433720 RepID=A0A819M354_9BILA|nr:unnamed protein product [Adineta steineri]CAF3973142.1 unnamed protein product [Adineta steineri]